MSMKRERGNRRNGGTYLSEEIAHPAPLNFLLFQIMVGLAFRRQTQLFPCRNANVLS